MKCFEFVQPILYISSQDSRTIVNNLQKFLEVEQHTWQIQSQLILTSEKLGSLLLITGTVSGHRGNLLC